MKKYKRKKHNKKIKNNLEKISENYKELFILLISILHGELFFVITDYTVEIINNYNGLQFSKIVLFYAIFFRIFQTQLLAALKYDGIWNVHAFDYIIVFITIFFEYIFFKYYYLANTSNIYGNAFIVLFALFGIFGYLHTYLTYSKSVNYKNKKEKKIQTINIIFLVVIIILELLTILFYSSHWIIVSNILVSVMLITNVYISLTFK